MRHVTIACAAALMLVGAAVRPAGAQQAAPAMPPAAAQPGFAQLEAPQNAANGTAGPRTVPGRAIPLPSATVSPEFLATVAGPYRVPAWNANPASAAEWKTLIDRLAAAGAAASSWPGMGRGG